MSPKSKLAALVFSLLLALLTSYVINSSVEALPEIVQLITYLSLPVVGGFAMLSFFSFLQTFEPVTPSVTSYLIERAADDPTRNFIIGFLVTAYVGLVRPPLTLRVSLLPYVEWAATASLVYVMFAMINRPRKMLYLNSESRNWKRHTQEIKREPGPDLTHVTSAMKEFVEQGAKERLLVYLTLHLQRLGASEEEILKTLNPLVKYQEDASKRRLYYTVFRWAKRSFEERERERRENLLMTLLEKIREGKLE